MFDRRLITQAVTNLVKNAGEAIEGRAAADDLAAGHILVEAGIEQQIALHPGDRQWRRPAKGKPQPAC